MSVSSILGNTETATNTTSSAYEDKEMFLKLLVAQLTYQDPLNPAEDTEFIAQLATFTQVEELQKLNEGMTSLVESYDRQQFVNATMLLGQRVLSEGSTISKVSDSETGVYSTTPVYFSSEVDMATCVVNVHGAGGYIIYSEDMGSRQAGAYNFTWDGTGPGGMVMQDGVYEFSISATDTNGNSIMVSKQVFGDVLQVEKCEDGSYNLHLLDGRSVKLSDVTMTGYVLGSKDPDETETPGDGNTVEPGDDDDD